MRRFGLEAISVLMSEPEFRDTMSKMDTNEPWPGADRRPLVAQ